MDDQRALVGEVVEEPADADSEKEFASLADLCEGARFVDKYYPQIDRTVRYRTYVPMDKMMGLQQRYNMTGGHGQRDSRGFIVAVLKEVLVRPRVETKEDEKLLLKSNASVLLDVLSEVMGQNDETYKRAVEDLGNS